MTRRLPRGAIAGLALGLAACATDPAPALPDDVTLTWLSVTNWLLEAGATRILLDGYVGRVDRTTVDEMGGSTAPATPDSTTVRAVLDAASPGRSDIDLLLVGHTHWDHALDTPAWARRTGGRIIGARTACHQARAFGIETCTPVEGGETFDAGPVHIRAVRWPHSGDSITASGRRLRAPLELRTTPVPDPVTGGLQPGYLRDYPNGGGARAYLITVRTSRGPLTVFWSETANPQAWDAPVPADSVWFREQGIDVRHLAWSTSDLPARDHLAQAMAQEGLQSVDVWIGFPSTAHLRQVVPVLHPRAFVPQHWDDFWVPLLEGAGEPPNPAPLETVLDSAGSRVVMPRAVFDRFRLTPDGLEALGPGQTRERFRQ